MDNESDYAGGMRMELPVQDSGSVLPRSDRAIIWPAWIPIAVAKLETVKTGGRTLCLVRLTITDAGRQALAG